jgi:hypothetical protein
MLQSVRETPMVMPLNNQRLRDNTARTISSSVIRGLTKLNS